LEPLTAECFTPINTYPKILDSIVQWNAEQNKEMQNIEEVTGIGLLSGSGPILMIDGNNVELTCGMVGFGNYYDGKVHEGWDEIHLKLWRSLLELCFKHGVQYYMMGDFNSRVMVDMGAYPKEYYNMLKSIKMTLDPKCILSRGKYNLWSED
jgi:hypothetical protein